MIDKYLASLRTNADGDVIGRVPYLLHGIWRPKWVEPVTKQGIDLLVFPNIENSRRLPEDWVQLTEPSGAEILQDFVELADADKAGVFRFASKWGPIYECAVHANCFYGGSDRRGCAWTGVESVSLWQLQAKRARAFLRGAAHLRAKETIPSSVWDDIRPHRPLDLSGGADYHAFVFTLYLSLWDSEFADGPHVRVIARENRPLLTLAPGYGFLPVVWLVLAQNITGRHGVYFCSGCGQAYTRDKKQPKAGGRNYCDRCGTKVAKKEWKRRKMQDQALEDTSND